MFGNLTALVTETKYLYIKAIGINLSHKTGRLMDCENLRKLSTLEE